LSNAALRKVGEEPGFVDEELNAAYRIAGQQPVDRFTIVPALLEDCDRGDHRLSSFQQYALYKGWEPHLDNLAVALGGKRLFEQGSSETPSDEEIYLRRLGARGEALHYAGDYEKALEVWLTVREQAPTSPVAWYNSGNALRRLGRYDEALASYSRAVEIDDNSVDAWFNRGNVLSDLGRPGEAIRSYDRALAIDPDDSGVLTRRLAALEGFEGTGN
jgi:tetratricopeptide (TPR) repeat protein